MTQPMLLIEMPFQLLVIRVVLIRLPGILTDVAFVMLFVQVLVQGVQVIEPCRVAKPTPWMPGEPWRVERFRVAPVLQMLLQLIRRIAWQLRDEIVLIIDTELTDRQSMSLP